MRPRSTSLELWARRARRIVGGLLADFPGTTGHPFRRRDHLRLLRFEGGRWRCLRGRLCHDHPRRRRSQYVHPEYPTSSNTPLIRSTDTGANASAEEADEGVEDGAQQVNNVVNSFRLTQTSFDKKSYLSHLKSMFTSHSKIGDVLIGQ